MPSVIVIITGLSMKIKGYSNNIIKLCDRNDVKYLDILNDISYYLYGKERSNSQAAFKFNPSTHKNDRKFFDHEKVQNHLTLECSRNTKLYVWNNLILKLIKFLIFSIVL